MKYSVLTLTEPWASLVVDGEKVFETRQWPTRFRGPLLIQAAKGFPRACRELCYDEPFASSLRRRADASPEVIHGLVYDAVEMLAPTLGHIIGAVTLVDTARTELVAKALEAQTVERARRELAFGDYTKGRWAFRLEKPIRFTKPIPVRGALGIWTLTEPELIDAVHSQLPAAA